MTRAPDIDARPTKSRSRHAPGWVAFRDEEAGPWGWGETRDEAVADLLAFERELAAPAAPEGGDKQCSE